jgi:phage-related protein
LADHGPSRRKNEFNVLGDGLYEAKAKSGPRVIFFYDQNSIVICAHAFDKQGQKTRRKDLDIARSRKRSYFERKRSGHGFMILTDKGTPPPERQP